MAVIFPIPISFLLIDMKTPGVTIEPIINLEGVHELNQVFFDDVRVPKANRVGAENEGWTVAKYLLEFERFSMASVELRRILNRVDVLARSTRESGGVLAENAAFRQRMDALRIDALALEMSEQRVLASLNAGHSPGSVSSVLNVRSAETLQRADMLGVEAAAYYGLPLQPGVLLPGSAEAIVGPAEAITIMPSYLSNRMRTIAGGSSEIQRNIIAKSILRL